MVRGSIIFAHSQQFLRLIYQEACIGNKKEMINQNRKFNKKCNKKLLGRQRDRLSLFGRVVEK
jgi:hypothetical protein